jgi:WhiB family redox-sensing transcriptional regulator
MIPGEWVERGVCAQIGGDVWYPEIGESKVTAKRMCARCDVIQQCAEYAIKTRQQEGVWGGMSPRERRKKWAAA